MFNNYRHLNECYKQFLDCESFAMPREVQGLFSVILLCEFKKFEIFRGGVWTPWHPLDQFMVKQRITVCKSGIEKINKIIENIVTALLQHI